MTAKGKQVRGSSGAFAWLLVKECMCAFFFLSGSSVPAFLYLLLEM